jgi:hypothetical protein
MLSPGDSPDLLRTTRSRRGISERRTTNASTAPVIAAENTGIAAVTPRNTTAAAPTAAAESQNASVAAHRSAGITADHVPETRQHQPRRRRRIRAVGDREKISDQFTTFLGV